MRLAKRAPVAVHAQPSQAHPGGWWQILSREMHEFPHALPFVQIRQHAIGVAAASEGVRDGAISLDASLPKLAVAVARIKPRTHAAALKPYRIAYPFTLDRSRWLRRFSGEHHVVVARRNTNRAIEI
jgi:hypothetical protein